MDQPEIKESNMVEELSFEGFRQAVINDYKIAFQSRQASLLGRKEVLTGKAKFGIFGDGKEIPQVAMAKFFKEGDFYAGYYRDQTFALATGIATLPQFFSQLYADPNPENEPHSAGRQMNCHFATPFIDKEGNFLDLSTRKNFSSGMAPTAGHFPKALGLAYASKLFKKLPGLDSHTASPSSGNEVVFCTIGDASTSEGHFWETMNAAAVSQVPLAVFVWDDGYGISVPKELQTVKASVSEALSGFEKNDDLNGILIYKVKGWDYANLCEVFEEGISRTRKEHVPVLFHIEELTQPQGHSTSGSHERYKSPERLQWERTWDCLAKMRTWIIDNALSDEEEIDQIEEEVRNEVAKCRIDTWKLYEEPIRIQKLKTINLIQDMASKSTSHDQLSFILQELSENVSPFRRDIMIALRNAISLVKEPSIAYDATEFLLQLVNENKQLYNSHLYFQDNEKIGDPNILHPNYDEDSQYFNGYEILNKYFDEVFEKNPLVVAFGEDLGRIGDVNQGFAGLQQKYGADRIFDTGIRELTIIGQGVGLSMRGLRPIAEIQYLDYLLFGLQVLSDDAATLHYRSAGQQIAPIIVRTRGHRLEGIWHSGSPMGLMVNALKGFHLCVPRNMVQAVGFYNTLLDGKNPSIVVECLNGYRLKEKMPSALTDFKLPLGVPEVIREGSDITIVSYGSTLRIVADAAKILELSSIDVEIIDIQTLLPFDLYEVILASLKKTNRILFVDEDVPGGATSFMFSEVIEKQGGYRWLDVSPKILCAKSHRHSYGSDGDYFSKPNVEDVFSIVTQMMSE
jgi:pyruvate/2-oxoglutarate/acetoin dehydrogenase E1 component/TPP-dependent pyruvate/acetoin dehydrogenase alpha subunit